MEPKRESPPVNTFREKLGRCFTLTFESDPPKGMVMDGLLDRIGSVVHHFDATMVADNTFATLRLSNIAFSHILQSRFGVPVVMHQTARDINYLGLHSHLMGAWTLGIRNLLLMTGDSPRFGSFPDSTPVYDFNSVKLIEMVKRLNRGDVQVNAKHRITGNTDFTLGCVSNPYVPNLKAEVARLKKKVDAGAQFVVTQPVFDRRTCERFLEYTADLKIVKIIGVMLVKGFQNALSIASVAPDLFIPAEVFERLKAKDSPEEGLAIAKEFIHQVKDMVGGIHIFPLARYKVLSEFAEFRVDLPAQARG